MGDATLQVASSSLEQMNLFVNTDETLVRQCLKGDRSAQKRLYDRFSARMFAVCRRYCTGYDEATDVLQLSFIKIFDKLSSWSGGSLESWVKTIVVRTAIDQVRASRKLMLVEETTEELNWFVLNQALDRLASEDLIRLTHELPEGYRVIFNMVDVEGFSHKEVAETLGISEGTSKSQLSRARKQLQKKILAHYNQFPHESQQPIF